MTPSRRAAETANESTKRAVLAIANAVRRQHGLGPCEWDQIEERHQIHYQLQAQAAWFAYTGINQ
jgi:hypothetical protein